MQHVTAARSGRISKLMRIAIELVAALVLALLVGMGTAGCQDAEPEPFAIAWNYDTSGYLETCGCSSHQLGGIARRAGPTETETVDFGPLGRENVRRVTVSHALMLLLEAALHTA